MKKIFLLISLISVMANAEENYASKLICSATNHKTGKELGKKAFDMYDFNDNGGVFFETKTYIASVQKLTGGSGLSLILKAGNPKTNQLSIYTMAEVERVDGFINVSDISNSIDLDCRYRNE